MADANVIQPSFASGELSPALYSRVDLAKYHAGAATMLNFFVDYRGGASTRPGTQHIALVSTRARLIPFIFSTTVGQSYILVFADQQLWFVKNPGTSAYANSTNSGPVLASGGGNYIISTPYVSADLGRLEYSQSGDTMYLTHPSYPRMVLKRFADNNWTLTEPGTGTSIDSPPLNPTSITSRPTGSNDPTNTTYLYTVTAVSADGEESNFGSFTSVNGIDIASTPGSIHLNWSQSTNASYYKVYKCIPTSGNYVPSVASDFGFAGFAYGTSFTDGNIVADFTQTPPIHKNPFDGGQIIGYNITSGGSGYPNYPPPITISDSTGQLAYIMPITSDPNSGSTSDINGLRIINHGANYTAPSVTVGGPGSGFAVTFTLGPATQFPTCSAFFQQRLVYASTQASPLTLWGSRPGYFDNFDVSNPTIDSDSFQFNLNAQQVNAIKHMLPMPGGLVLFSDAGVSQLTGGSASASNPLAVTPSSAVIVPQTYFGCGDPKPIAIGYQILYVQSEGSFIRELTYNFFVNIYTGVDVSVLSSHLFYPRQIVEWAYQDSPNKVVWAVRDDGVLLSLTYLKEQEVQGWARHTTNGSFESVATVREGNEDAVYFVVNRNGVRMIERLAGRVYTGISDAWCLDSALSTIPGGSQVGSISLPHLVGQSVYALADGVVQGPFTVPSGGTVTLTTPATNIVAGLAFTPQLQTLYLDVGEQGGTIQGKRKKISAMSVRVKDTAGLSMGTTFGTLTPFTAGLSSTDPLQPSLPGLYTGDQRIVMDPIYSVVGQMCVQAGVGVPATVLAVIPEITLGDSSK